MHATLIGYGEAGQAFDVGGDWRAYDVLPARSKAASLAEALDGAGIVLSLVTADQTLAVAREAARCLAPGALYCDMNSVAPGTKHEAAAAIEAAGGRYVDVAVMAPVNPARLAVPLLVSGRHVGAALAALAQLGFSKARSVGAEVGKASAIKMIRSVMVKGVEALSDEMMAAAEAAGVSDDVLAALDASETAMSWTERAAYNRERMASHGLRRAAEMEDAARTLAALGVDPVMTRGTILRQRAAAKAPQESP